jgi:hypothetical protein
MTERSRPVPSPSPADLIETLLKDAGREATPPASAVSPVSVTINLAAGAVLNISIGAARDSKEG